MTNFRDRISSTDGHLHFGDEPLANVHITLNANGTIAIGALPEEGVDAERAAEAFIKFITDDYICTGIALIRNTGVGDPKEGVEVIDKIMQIWKHYCNDWDKLTEEEKLQILTHNRNEDATDGQTD